MKNTSKIFAFLSLIIVAAMLLASCAPKATEAPSAEEPAAEEPAAEEPAAEEPTAESEAIVAEEATPTPIVLETSEYGEAPMLAEMVAAGELPPVEERLPVADDIFVVAGVDGIGEYGGTWHNASWWQGMGNIEMNRSDVLILNECGMCCLKSTEMQTGTIDTNMRRMERVCRDLCRLASMT